MDLPFFLILEYKVPLVLSLYFESIGFTNFNLFLREERGEMKLKKTERPKAGIHERDKHAG